MEQCLVIVDKIYQVVGVVCYSAAFAVVLICVYYIIACIYGVFNT